MPVMQVQTVDIFPESLGKCGRHGLGEECKTPGMPYIVFPGNVGGDDAVTTVVNELACM